MNYDKLRRELKSLAKNPRLHKRLMLTLDWIENLEKERDAAVEDLKKALWDDEVCSYCKHNYHCGDTKCDEYIEGVGMTDEKGNYYDWEWSCLDFDWGTCSKLENTPCNGCDLINHFEWRGINGNN